MSKNIDDYMPIINAAWNNNPDPDFIQIFKFGISTIDENNPKGGFSGKGSLNADYIRKIIDRYLGDKSKKITLNDMSTKPDKAVELIAIAAGKIPEKEIENANSAHRWLMQSENILGTLLEKYIDSRLREFGWLWCAGSFIKAVDFIYFDNKRSVYHILQIKNSDNSENSSSSAIRKGTNIEKWFRRYANNGKTNWPALNTKVKNLCGYDPELSEDKFFEFIKNTVNP